MPKRRSAFTGAAAVVAALALAGCGGNDDQEQAAEEFLEAVSSLEAAASIEEDDDARYAEFTEEARDVQTEVANRVQEETTSVDRQSLRAFLGDAMVSWDVLAEALESDNAITADEFSNAALAVAELKATLASD